MAQLFLKMQIDFYTDEGKTETGESQYMLQPLPGGKAHPPSIVSTAWNPMGLRFVAPAEAKFMVVSFRCDSSAERGAISGTVYFDDFTVSTDKAQQPDGLLQPLMGEAAADAPPDSPAVPEIEGDAKPTNTTAKP